MSVDGDIFKNILRRWATGITVITTLWEDNWRGFTANSFASVSMEPPLISMNVAKRLDAFEYIEQGGVFAVNILAEDQLELGKLFAGFTDVVDRFEGLDCAIAASGCPLLPDTLGWVDCKVFEKLDVGSNMMYIGEVMSGSWSEEGTPLLYHKRQWGGFKVLEHK